MSAASKSAPARRRKAASKGQAKKKGSAVVGRRPATSRGVRPRDVAAELLKKQGVVEIGVRELAELTIADRRVKLKGKTPAATVAAQIYVAAAKGELFKKTTRGMVALLVEPKAA